MHHKKINWRRWRRQSDTITTTTKDEFF